MYQTNVARPQADVKSNRRTGTKLDGSGPSEQHPILSLFFGADLQGADAPEGTLAELRQRRAVSRPAMQAQVAADKAAAQERGV